MSSTEEKPDYDQSIYDAITRDVDSGGPITRERIVKTIYADYRASRVPCREIAQRLNRHRVPSPTGGAWEVSAVQAAVSEAIQAVRFPHRLPIGTR
jgi:hypothetical protein